MKALLSLVAVQLISAASLRAQTPTPLPSADYVVVEGRFMHPGLVVYTTGMGIFAAIEGAGGFIDFANVKTIYLIRCGKKERINLALLRSHPSDEPTLQPWDIIYLPQSIF